MKKAKMMKAKMMKAKAKRERCGACGRWILPGENRNYLGDDDGWLPAHLDCFPVPPDLEAKPQDDGRSAAPS